MSKLDNNVKSLFNNSKVWHISTMSDTPNVVPILFKKIDENDNLILFDVFMKKTIDNIGKNGKIALSAYNLETLEGYQLKGAAKYSSDAALIEEGNSVTKNFNLTTKGALIVTVEQAIVLTPGPDIGKTL